MNRVITLNNHAIYARKQRLWRAYCDFAERLRRAFFPDTGGVSLYLHNWYICDEKRNPAGAKLAQWIEDSAYDRYKRIKAKLTAYNVEREHMFNNHSKRGFDPLWCPICHPEKARSYGYQKQGDRWIKEFDP